MKGTTDGDGKLTILSPVPIRVARVVFEKRGLTFSVLLGDMDPITEISGVQARLKALGYLKTTATGELDEATEAALRKFQEAKHLPITGTADSATLEALKADYGC
jgi:peptidoglycan hydrolase-like protein with peptidoglycan-binding domain